MKLSKNIKSLLLSLLEDKVVVSSWGISSIFISDTSIKFDVNGMNYQGTVVIESLNNKDYNIIIGNKNICLNSSNDVINWLDSEIEKTNDYLFDLQRCLKL